MRFKIFIRPAVFRVLPAGAGILFLLIAGLRFCPSLPAADATNGLPSQLITEAPRAAPREPMEAERRKVDELNAVERRAKLLPTAETNLIASTNAPLEVKGYDLIGNTLLPPDITELVLRPYIGTNMNFDMLRRGLRDLQMVYRDRGYVTVSVRLPQQKLTNGIVKVRVFEGRLSNVILMGNRYFSSNNVMRSLPGLHTNMILTAPVFQAELDRANANLDRQISPQIEPGPDEGTTALRLIVKDQLPLHAKIELNNENSPGTPDLRVNSSAVYNNLWQAEHSVGVQYSFSPELYKSADSWQFYDKPLIANYSGFYRLPLGGLQPMQNVVEAMPGTFGYDEAKRKFNLPPPSGRPELNIYASRSTIDTGVLTVFSGNVFNTNGNSLDRTDLQQDFTVSQDIGFRLTTPMPVYDENFQSSVSGGLDFKTFDSTSFKTNIFTLNSITIDNTGGGVPVTNVNHSVITSPVPTTDRPLQYVPLTIRYDASFHEDWGTTAMGFAMSVNLWHSGNQASVQNLSGSTQSSGYWVIYNQSFSQDFNIYKDWVMSLKADAQWASEPLISNEQYGAGGIASVRGYHEGEVFGDNGWHVTLEQKTPNHLIGLIAGKTPLTIRATVYMDYAETYLIDPQGRQASTPLWSTGIGAVVAAGSHWEARMWFSEPLLGTTTTGTGQPVFNFSLTAQF